MDLVGAWLRQLLRAGTLAALVPIAVVASLVVVVAGSGGVSGLGALGQVVTGPEISPPASIESAATPGEREAALVAPPDLVASARPLAATQTDAGAGAGSNAAPPPPAPPSRRVVIPRTPSKPTGPLPPITPPPLPPPPAVAPPPAHPPTARERTGKVVEELGETVGEVVGGVGEVIGGLGETLGGLLGGPPPGR
jgi:hypothetical protein